MEGEEGEVIAHSTTTAAAATIATMGAGTDALPIYRCSYKHHYRDYSSCYQ